jgi:predicted dehydrogenase
MYQESMARDVAECHAMIDAVQQRGRALMIAHRLSSKKPI